MQHPEQRDNEIFVGYVSANRYRASRWQTKRAGTRKRNRVPLFVSRREIERAIAATAYAGSKRALAAMLKADWKPQ